MKQFFLFIAGTFGFAAFGQVSVYNCQTFDPVVSPVALEAIEPGTFHKPCVLLDSVNTYFFDLDDQLEITADESIHIQENFRAGQFSATGSMHLQIKPQENLDVLVMNYPDLNHVERFGKLELAVVLPQNINDLVQDFVQYGQSPTNVNPFDPQQLEIKAYFSPLYNGNWQNPWIGHGFYYEEYERSADTLTWNALPTPGSNFRIRFAPRATGLYRCAISVYCAVTGEYFDLNEFQFNVVDVGLPDFMRVGENGRYFKIGGEPFYPFGMNMPTQGRNTAYSTTGTEPKDYVKYMGELQELSDAGANYFRYMNQPYSTEIEFETLGDYSDRMYRAWEMDQLVDTLASMDMRMHYCLTYTLPLTYTGVSNSYFWDWSSQGEAGVICDLAPTGIGGDVGYCYHTDPNYGVATIDEFFSDPDQIRYYKNRLRYYVSRYGYSTSIGVLEFMNEINFAGVTYPLNPVNCSQTDGSPDDKPYYYDTAFVHKISDWQIEMARYIKEELWHGNHLLAADYGGAPNEISGDPYYFPPGTEEDGISTFAGDYSYLSPYIDIREYHDYHAANEKYEWMSKEITYYESFTTESKPYFMAEIGVGKHGCDNQHTHKQQFIITPFTGAAGAGLPWHYNSNQPTWDDVAERNDALSTIPSMAQFLNTVDLNQDEWYNDFDVRKDKAAEVIYLRDFESDARKAIGVINNRTVNRYTLRESWCDSTDCDCYIDLDDLDDVPDVYETRATIGWNQGGSANELKLDNMGFVHKYIIKFYDPFTLTPLSTEEKWTGIFGNLNLKYPTLNDQPESGNGYDAGSMILFKAYRESDGAFISHSNNGNSEDEIFVSRNVVTKYSDVNLPYVGSNIPFPNEIIELELKPNPAKDRVEIQLKNLENTTGSEVLISDVLGKQVYASHTESNAISVHVDSWKSGIYYVLWNNNGMVYSKKLIVL